MTLYRTEDPRGAMSIFSKGFPSRIPDNPLLSQEYVCRELVGLPIVILAGGGGDPVYVQISLPDQIKGLSPDLRRDLNKTLNEIKSNNELNKEGGGYLTDRTRNLMAGLIGSQLKIFKIETNYWETIQKAFARKDYSYHVIIDHSIGPLRFSSQIHQSTEQITRIGFFLGTQPQQDSTYVYLRLHR